MAPQASYGTQMTTLVNCKHGSPICVLDEGTKEEGLDLCEACQVSHPMIALKTIEKLVETRIEEEDYPNARALRDSADYEALWAKPDDEHACAWRQKRFSDNIMFADDMLKARRKMNMELKKMNPSVQVNRIACIPAEDRDHLCANCLEAKEKYGSSYLKSLLYADGKTFIQPFLEVRKEKK
jgi:hypothetical protein